MIERRNIKCHKNPQSASTNLLPSIYIMIIIIYSNHSATFKKMFVQKRREQIKDYEKQEKKLKELKAQGKSTKQAVSLSGYL